MQPVIQRADLPRLLRLLTYSGTSGLIRQTALRTVALFLVSVLLATSHGQLGVTGGTLERISCDLRTLLQLSCRSEQATEIPLIRDYASLWHLFMIAFISAHFWQLVDAQRQILPTLSGSGVVRNNRAKLRKRSREAAARISAPKTNWIILLIALTCGVAGYAGYAIGGIYPSLVGSDGATAKLAFDQWWIEGSILTRIWFQVVALIGNYINVWALYILLEFCALYVWALRRCEWRLVTGAQDGRWGWAPVYDLMRIGITWLTVTGIGLIGIFLIVRLEGIWFLLAFPSIFLLALVPVALVNRFYAAARNNRKYLQLIQSPLLRRLEDVSLKQAPDRLIPFSRLFTQALIGILPLLLALYDLIGRRQ